MKKLSFYAVLLSVVLVSCYPKGAEYYGETDIVFTNYNDEFDFSSQKTYAMPDSIVKVTGNIVDDEMPEFIKEPYNTDMLNMIAGNMETLGWTRINDPEKADVVLMPVAWKNTTIYYWYDYWCWWYPYYCGWGYYPYVYSSYTTGTLVMSMVVDDDGYVEPETVWTGALNGLLSGSYNADRVSFSIDQAFKQSPYLEIN